jgi:SNF2 family DNA or RNA helicase
LQRGFCMKPEFETAAQRNIVETGQQFALHVRFRPGLKLINESAVYIWVGDENENPDAIHFENLSDWLAALGFAPGAMNHERGVLQFTGEEFVQLIPFLMSPDCPFALGESIYWFARTASTSFHFVEIGDLLAFASPVDLSMTDLIEACFSFAFVDEESSPSWCTGNGVYISLWIPGFTEAKVRALRFTYVAIAEKVCKWDESYPWTEENHARMITDTWIIVCVNALMKQMNYQIVNHEEKSDRKSSYRVMYRGEQDVLSAWRTSLEEGPFRTFAADGWLIARILRQSFQGSGWRADWMLERSGSAYYQLVFELTPPAGEDVSRDWSLRYMIMHRFFGYLVPFCAWWHSPTRTIKIENDILVKPDEWILQDLNTAGRLYEPILISLKSDAPYECKISSEDLFEFVSAGLPALRDHGYIVRTPEIDPSFISNVRIRVRVRRPKQKQTRLAKLQHVTGHWFQSGELVDFDWSVAIGDTELSRAEFEKLVKDKTPYVQLGGSWRLVPVEEIFNQIAEIGLGESKQDIRVMDLSRMLLMGEEEAVEKDGLQIEVSYSDEAERIKELMYLIQHARDVSPMPAPKSFCGSLRQYQSIGYAWLLHLRQIGFGACLADDMGLGKTIQVLAYLLQLKETGERKGAHLLVCPTSLVQNWKAEIARFAPNLKQHLHHGSSRNIPLADGKLPLQIAVTDADIIITTYSTIVRDIEWFEELAFDVVVVDEAQNIKNAQTKQSQAIFRLNSNHRVALTGTPIENRLEELWSILHFANPGYLGKLSWFRKMFADPISTEPHGSAAKKLQRIIQPILLRRRKTEPAIQIELPEKWELMDYAGLTTEQAAVYQSVVNRLFEGIDHNGPMARRGQILAALVRLKQVCDHPCLITGGSGDVNRSGKLKLLLELLSDVVEEGESALIFTQFRDMGELLCEAISKQFSYKPRFLHGGLTSVTRGKIVDDFQSGADNSPILVLSLKAGGVGLNLTRANHVFHFDRWWNPAVEDQATDRAFRIGQTRDVQVHKLVCSGTLEDRIDAMIASKRQLSEAIVSAGENFVTELDDASLRALFDLDADVAIGEEL